MRDDQTLLDDILDQIENIEQDVCLGLDKFNDDRHIQDSLALRIGYVGEALSRVSKPFRDEHPEIPWEDAISMRAKLFHDYFDINKSTIWKTASFDIPELKKTIVKILKETP